MTKKDITDKVKIIKSFLKNDNEFAASIEFGRLSSSLHEEKKYDELVNIYNSLLPLINDCTNFYDFELAFAFSSIKNEDQAEKVYEYLLASNPKNSAVLNNLSNIKKTKRKFKEAFDLISTAYSIEPQDSIISNNYESLSQIMAEQKEKEQKFKYAFSYLEKENQFVITKLLCFIQNAKKDNDYNNGQIPIANWKFKILMQTDDIKANSLKEQWLEKNYITNTGQRDEHYVIVYELNPYIEKALSEIKFKTVNPNWIKGIEKINIETLNEINYYRNLKKIHKTNKKYKTILIRDFDELTLNYLVKNNKSTIVLAGSLIETLLIYYLEKSKIKNVEYEVNDRKVSKNLYESTLNDLLQFLEQNKMLEKQFVHLGNISRIFRNYVHPGKEIRETEELTDTKGDLCYISASELINNLI